MSIKTIKTYKHPYHLVDPSPWPLIAAMGCLFFTFGLVMFFHGYLHSIAMINTGLIAILFCMFTWWRDIIREATFEGQHTRQVQQGLRYGMILFIVSELMFFFVFVIF